MSRLVLVIAWLNQFRRPLLAGVGCVLIAWFASLIFRPKDTLLWTAVPGYGIKFPLRYTVHGLDVSRHNNRIDWDRVAAMNEAEVRMAFVFIKATEGATLGDPTFAKNWKEAKRVGIRRGAYHFYHPTRDPIKQANNFIKRVKLIPGDFAPVLDFEVTNNVPGEKIVADLRLFLDALEDEYSMKPIIYTNSNLYTRYIKPNFNRYPLWIADYSKRSLDRYDTDQLYIWQHNKNGWVKGIRGEVDLNTFVMNPDRIHDICLD